MKIDRLFEFGDVVSRDGTDEHLVIKPPRHEGDNMTVLCIKEPDSKWVKIGEKERNTEYRYDFLYKMINPVPVIKEISKKYKIRW